MSAHKESRRDNTIQQQNANGDQQFGGHLPIQCWLLQLRVINGALAVRGLCTLVRAVLGYDCHLDGRDVENILRIDSEEYQTTYKLRIVQFQDPSVKYESTWLGMRTDEASPQNLELRDIRNRGLRALNISLPRQPPTGALFDEMSPRPPISSIFTTTYPYTLLPWVL